MCYRRSLSVSWLILAIVILSFTNLQAAAAQPDVLPTSNQIKDIKDIESVSAISPLVVPKEATSLIDLIPPDLPLIGVTEDQIQTESGFFPREKVTIGNDGGAAIFLSDQVLVMVNKEMLAADQTLFVYETDVNEATTAPEGGVFRFQVMPKDSFSDSFSQPIYMAFDMRSLGIVEADWFVVRRPDASASMWEYLPVEMLDTTGLFSVRSDYLTGDIVVGAKNYQLEEAPMMMASATDPNGDDSSPAPWRYQWTLPTVSSFSGAATYSYPIEVPPGRNGLQPNVNISYSSRGVDGLVVTDGQDQGELGLGWSIGNIEITRSGMYYFKNGGGCEVELPNSFSLVLNGQSHRLVPYGSPGQYQAINNPGIRVRMVEDRTVTDINSDGIYWTVETPDGTTYRLGYPEEAETGQRVSWGIFDYADNSHQYEGKRGEEYAGFRWRVDTVTDVYGNQVQYFYDDWEEDDSDRCSEITKLHATNARLEEIRYNFVNLASDANTRVDGNYASKILFNLNADKRVEDIKLFHADLVNPYQVIDIGLSQAGGNNLRCAHGEWKSKTQTVTYIRQESGDRLYRLPKTEFGYIPQLHGTSSGEVRGDDPAESGYENPNCWEFQYLHTVDNGYGGEMQFNYEGDNRAYYPDITVWDTVIIDGEEVKIPRPVRSNVPNYGQSYYVTSVHAWDGEHGVPAVIDYTYDEPCYDETASQTSSRFANAGTCATPGMQSNTHGNLVGFNLNP